MSRREMIDKLLDEALDACLARVKKCAENSEANGAMTFASTAEIIVRLMQVQNPPKGAN